MKGMSKEQAMDGDDSDSLSENSKMRAHEDAERIAKE
jgi:hypothetical protein